MDEESSQKQHEHSTIDTELEEKFLNFWKKYQGHLIVGVVMIFLSIVGFQGVKFYQNYQVRKLQDEYMEEKLAGSELEFAEAHAMEPLSGVIWLKAGDDAYEKNDFAESIKYYKKSVKALRKTLLKGRGGMGIAMANIMSGGESVGKDLLVKLVHDKQAMGVVRGQAAYQLALMSLESKDYKESSEFLDMIKHIPDSGIWEQKGLMLTESTTELVLLQVG